MPFFFEAAILSRMRSAVTSRSNWAKDSRTLRVSRPMDVVVLNCWVTETNDTLVAVEDLDHPREIHQGAGQTVDLVDDDHIDGSCLDVGKQLLQGRALHRPARDAAIIISLGNELPAETALRADIGFTGLPLGIERVEFLLETLFGGFPGVDSAAKQALASWREEPRARPMSAGNARAMAESDR